MSHRNRNRHRPQIEALESWVPLSGAAAALPGGAVAAARAPIVAHQGTALALSGTVQGGYVVSGIIPDIGKTYQFGVAGRISPLGQTGDSGQIHTTGFIAMGSATGTMTISAPRGALKLQLNGPPQAGFAPLPSTMTYTITGGNGAYKKTTGTGTIAIMLTSNVFSYGFGLMTISFYPGTPRST
jgi:hypothetical protein